MDRQNLIASTDIDMAKSHRLNLDDEEDEPVLLEKPGHKRRQAFKDNLTLGPIDKYIKYGIFPYKFVIHIILMFLTMWQVLLQILPSTDY